MRFGLNECLISEIIAKISKYPDIQKAVIFGSRARGDYKYNSDINIAIFNGRSQNISGRLLSDFAELDTIFKFDVVEFEKLSNQKLIHNILNEEIEIYHRS